MITLIGQSLAKEGFEFQYRGPLLECRSCKLKNVCFNLDEGKWYRITKVRDKEHECKIHEGGKVVTVEVEEIPVPIAISTKNVVEGETIAYKPINCKEYACEYYHFCHPLGLRDGFKIKIVKVVDNIECKGNKKNLKKVLVTW
ncbi:MAG TPA: UPF0179 family protein [Candidatus Aciduliprofundum boonei]|uniref:UPF0179 protein ENL31_00475 n=1 Tax=Candidatus Aciduliprofundum boonei TaxID=379547 RepID=A0A7J3T8L0_9ARCH|nr:UPF0179 family protein [Candidatus Aciduliprofundum boonei]